MQSPMPPARCCNPDGPLQELHALICTISIVNQQVGTWPRQGMPTTTTYKPSPSDPNATCSSVCQPSDKEFSNQLRYDGQAP
jgi:hypothetical protein